MKHWTIVATAFFVVACSGDQNKSATTAGNQANQSTGGTALNGAGATFPYPIYSKWFSEYAATTGVKINYQSIGSGGGIRQLSEQTVDFGASDAPMTDAEIDAMAADLKPIVVPDLVLFAESKGKPIGFGLSLPDINVALWYNKKGRLLPGLFQLYFRKKEINLVRVIVLGVLPEYLNTGAGGVLFYETAVRAKKLGYAYGEASWVLEDNLRMVKSAEAMKGKITRRYRIYEKPVA